MSYPNAASYRRVKWACYTTNVSMSVVGNLSPVLFLTFHELYGISYTLLGLLVLINFFTQLVIDLIFSFFSHKFNIPLTVKLTPALTVAGLLVYALWPFFSPDTVYIGLVIGTVIFSLSGGLSEVLISPVIAAIPADDPDREMSKLHSVYAWGVVGVILFASVFLLVFHKENWQWLALLCAVIPLVASLLFCGTKLPRLDTPERVSGALSMLKNKQVLICVAAIFFGGAAECTMAQWCSGYLEAALHIPKIWGDIFGVALFSVMLGLGRTLYAKRGRFPERVLLLGGIGAATCYLIAALSGWPILGLLACAFTGFCVSMLWPGSLIVASSRVPNGGVFIYALMAAGGDMGAAIGPQLVGVITDATASSPTLVSLAETWSLAPEQLGMKLGMLVGMLFPLLGIAVYGYLMHGASKSRSAQEM